MNTLVDFIRESNRIEGIIREPSDPEVDAHRDFLSLESIDRNALKRFVGVVQPGAVLRDREGLNVRVGSHIAPPGGTHVVAELARILADANARKDTPFGIHCRYLTLHPFMDGNGRSSRALWLWMHGGTISDWVQPDHPFLQSFYYEALDAHDSRGGPQ